MGFPFPDSGLAASECSEGRLKLTASLELHLQRIVEGISVPTVETKERN